MVVELKQVLYIFVYYYNGQINTNCEIYPYHPNMIAIILI